MLHLKKVLGAKPKEHVEAELAVLSTPWGEALDSAHVLEEHPTPQFARESFRVLNGEWRCAFVEGAYEVGADLVAVTSEASAPEQIDTPIIVPFSPEAPLSGVGRQLKPGGLLWYRTMVELSAEEAGKTTLLHFQAVDYACTVRVNGELAGTHVGGYMPFTLDATELVREGENELLVCVADPSEYGAHLRGKQRLDRGDIWYTAQCGIWQTVWLESVPQAHVESAVIEPDPKTGIVAIGLRLKNAERVSGHVEVSIYDGLEFQGESLAVASCDAESACAIALHVPDVKLWSPEDPHLYAISIAFGDDRVESYCGFRSVEVREDTAGHKRVFLNDKPVFIKGVLDQAYWSDGLMTAPSDEALVYDIQAMLDDGFNLMRKHIKIEAERWYYHCDRMGMLVLQDMVSGGGSEICTWHWSYKPTLFKFSWRHYRDDVPRHWENLGAGDAAYRNEWTATCRAMVEGLRNHPCIIGWSLFNEGWGQFQSQSACELVRSLDPTRVIDAVSGWYDQGGGDFCSVHNYFRDHRVWRIGRAGRAFFTSEFGGYTHRVEGHSALDEAYGYEPYEDSAEWRGAVRGLLSEMDALEARGLAGYIYTQASDVEEETNGILTYDRRVNKLAEYRE